MKRLLGSSLARTRALGNGHQREPQFRGAKILGKIVDANDLIGEPLRTAQNARLVGADQACSKCGHNAVLAVLSREGSRTCCVAQLCLDWLGGEGCFDGELE